MYIDIAVGLIIGWGASLWAGDQHLLLMAFGVFATLAPDIDFFVWLWRNNWQVDKFAHEHRDLFHLPLVTSLAGGLLIGFFDPLYGTIWFLGTLAHFIHDTLDGGWGIRWLYPFHAGYFTFASHSPQHYYRDKVEQHAMAERHGNPQVVKEQYMKLNPKLFKELAVLALVCLGLIWWFVWRNGA